MTPWTLPIFAARNLLVFTVLIILNIWPSYGHSQIVINELMADPATDWNSDGQYDYRTDEWIEVLNTGDQAVDLTAYWLRDSTGDQPHLNLFGVLEAHCVAVFYGSNAVAWQQENGVSVTGFSLNNSGDSVYLLRTLPGTDGPQLALEDTVTYLSHEAEDDRSSGLDPAGETWVLYDGLNAYGGDAQPQGTGCGPTPGTINVCDALPVHTQSFGAVKATYR